jgi:hypothetical protein
MSVIVNKSITLTFTNNPALGATQISADGSQFSVSLDNPINIPKSAVSCTGEIISASVWYVQPNISTTLKNNNFTYIYNGDTYEVLIPDGLYSLDQLSSYISKKFLETGFDPSLITITGDDATQRTVLTFSQPNLYVNFDVTNSIRTVLGFNEEIVPSSPQAANYFQYSDTEAKFNSINNFYIRSNFTDGIAINNTNFGILTTVPIPTTNSVGRQIQYQPNRPIIVNMPELVGKPLRNLTFQLIDDQLRPCPTLGEFYSFTLQINYSILLTDKDVPFMQF